MEREILHVDVNNAFLSWSAIDMLKNGYPIDIRTIPAVIGGDEERRTGIVLAKSMKAKACGIVTGETLYQARKKCSGLSVFKGNHKFYKECSDKLYNLLLEYTDKIERFSIDECFLDMTGFLMNDTLLNRAIEISNRVKDELKFTVNIGVANNKLLAKMASDFSKPDKIHTLFKDEIPEKMWKLPVSELFMLGRQTAPKLNNMGIKTIGDLARFDFKVLNKKFGKLGKMIWEYANGIDNSEVNYIRERPKGIGNSVTLPKDISDKETLESVVLALTEQVTYRLRRENLIASTVNVQLRTKDFFDFSHQGKLFTPTSNTKEIYDKAKSLFNEMYKKNTLIRLIGVRVDNLTEKGKGQISLFDNNKHDERQGKIDETLDILKDKFGYDSVMLAGKMQMNKIIKPRD